MTKHYRCVWAIAITLIIQANASAGVVTYMGDAIGDDSSDTDGLGVFGAMVAGVDPAWRWDRNLGAPAFQYSSDGKATLNSLRSIATVHRRTTDPIDWDQHNWSVDIWKKEDYLAKGSPLHTVNMGATPSNWSGFKTLENGDVVPDAQPFGTPGGQTPPGTRSYEMIFDLSQHDLLRNPLPEGEYIISFTSRGGPERIGDAFLGYSWRGQGPDPHFSLDVGGSIAPGPVIGRLTDNDQFRWAMNMDIRSDLLNGNFADGLNHWETSGPGTVELIEVNGDTLAKFTAGSPAILSQSIITDPEDVLSFDYLFEKPAGQFDILLGDDLIASLSGEDLFSLDWTNFSITLDDPSLWGRQDDLRFIFDGDAGQVGYLNNITLGSISAVPEPGSLAALASISAIVGLASRRRKRKKVNEEAFGGVQKKSLL